ncbi:MAG: hypothetical protein SFY32_14550 [Bacteroidota bacterium]|nr:hypothetical protein [Bacteroidota bacterium]
MIKNYKLLFVTVVISLTSFFHAKSQSVGDYLCTTTGNWNDNTKWQKWDGSVWAPVATNDWPGNLSVSGLVTIAQNGATVTMTLNTSPGFAIGGLSITGTNANNAILTFETANNRQLNVAGSVILSGTNANAARLISQNAGSYSHILSVSGPLMNINTSGTFNLFSSSTRNINLVFSGTTISGSANYTFNNVTFNGSNIVFPNFIAYTFNGDFINNTNFFIASSGLVTFQKVGTQILGGSCNSNQFNNLNVGNNTATLLTLNQPITVAGGTTFTLNRNDQGIVLDNSTNNITFTNLCNLVRTRGRFSAAPLVQTGATYNVTYNSGTSLTADFELPCLAFNNGTLKNLTIGTGNATTITLISPISILGGNSITFNSTTANCIDNTSFNVSLLNNSTVIRNNLGSFQTSPSIPSGVTYNVNYQGTGTFTSGLELPIPGVNTSALGNVGIGNNTNTIITLSQPTTVTGGTVTLNSTSATTSFDNSVNNLFFQNNGATISTLVRTRGSIASTPGVVFGSLYNVTYNTTNDISTGPELTSSNNINNFNSSVRLTLNGSNFDLNNPLNLNGTFTNSSIFYFAPIGAQVVSVLGNFTGGTFNMTGSGLAHQLYLGGATNSITTLNTTPNSGSTIYYNGTGAQTVFGSPNYQNLFISGSGTKTFGGAVTIANNTTINGGILDPFNQALTANGPFSISGVGGFNDSNNGGINSFNSFFINNGTFAGTSVTTAANQLFNSGLTNNGTFNGGAATIGNNQTIIANSLVSFANNITAASSYTLTGSNTFSIAGGINATAGGNVTIDAPVTVSGGASAITGNLSITGSGQLLVSSPSTFAVTGSVVNNGTFIDNNNTAATTFTNSFLNNGTFNSSAVITNTNLILNGGIIQNNTTSGSFIVGNARSNVSNTISGTGPIQFLTGYDINGAAVTVTNNNTSVVSFGGTSQLSGTGTFVQGNGSLVSFANPTAPTVTNLITSTIGNTFEYSGSNQNIRGLVYNNLKLSGGGFNSLLGNTTVTGNLDLQSGITNLSTFNLDLTPNATIVGNTFSNNNMLATNSTGKLILAFNSLPSGQILFPIGTRTAIGSNFYSPVAITLSGSSIPTPPAFIQARAIPTVSSAQSNPQFSLAKHWVLSALGLNLGSASIDLSYSAVNEANATYESSYVPGLYNGSSWNISGSIISPTISIPAASTLNATITAGLPQSFQSLIFYSRQNGNWNDPNSWSIVTFGGAAAATVPFTTTPVNIGNNNTITITTNGISVPSLVISATGVLEIGNTSGHALGTISGNGTIRYTINDATTPQINLGTNMSAFFNSGNGTVEFLGSGSYLIPQPTNNVYNNIVIGGGSSSVKTKSTNTNLTLNGNLNINSNTQFNHNSNNLFQIIGTTSVLGTGVLIDNVDAGILRFDGPVFNNGIITTTGIITAGNLLYNSGFINNGTFNGGAATIGNNQTITANSLVSFANSITAASSYTLIGSNTFSIAGGINATAGGNVTIDAPVTVSGGASAISGNLSITGNGQLLVSSPSTFAVTGSVVNSGSFIDNDNTAATTFTNTFINNGTFNSSAVITNTNLIINGGIVQNNTTSGSFIIGNARSNVTNAISGSGPIQFLNGFDINGAAVTVTNNNTSVVSFGGTSQLSGTGTFVQGNGSLVSFANPTAPTITTLNTSLNSNTVAYVGNNQNIRGNIQYNNLILSASGINTFANNITVSGNIQISNGVNNLGNNNIILIPGATVSGTPSTSAFIITTGTGVFAYQLNSIPSGSLVYPIGTGTNLYSPAFVLVNNASVTNPAQLNIRAVASKPSNQIDNTYSLNKHWIISSSNLSSTDLNLTFNYQSSEANTTYESSYVAACWTGTVWSIVGTVSSQTITINNTSLLNTTCTAGPPNAFTAGTYYSRADGDWDNPNTWSTVSLGGPAASTPALNGSTVIIGNNNNVTISGNSKTTNALQLNGGSTLELGTTSLHNFGTSIVGTGTISYTINNATNPIIPGGTLTTFMSASGGTFAFGGTGNYVIPQPTGNSYNNVVISGGGTKTKSAATNLSLNGGLTVTGATVFDHTSNNNLVVNAQTLINGTFSDNNNSGVDSFTGLVTNNGIFSTTGVTTPANLVFLNGINNNGSFLGGAATLSNTNSIVANSPILFSGAVAQNGNITFSGISSISLANNLTSTNNLTINQGGTTSVLGTSSFSNGFSILSTGGIFFNGLVSQTGLTWNSQPITNPSLLNFTTGFTKTVNNTSNFGAATFNSNAIITNSAATSINFNNLLSATGVISFAGNNQTTLNGGARFNSDVYVNTGATLRLGSSANVYTVVGNLFGSGTIDFQSQSTILNLSGAQNSMGFFINVNNSTVNYIGSNQGLAGVTYNSLNFPGSGIKTLASNTTLSSSIIIPSGVTLLLPSNSNLKIASNQMIDNQGTFSVSGSSLTGFANIANNGVGVYSITQSTSGAVFGANFFTFNNLGNGGLNVSNGSIDPNGTFNNGSFSNGSGTQYINLTGLNISPDVIATNTTFTGGPTFNVTKPNSGVITFNDAKGSFSGSAFTNPNPTSNVIWTNPSSTYFSQNVFGLFSDLNNWKNGSGNNPTLNDFTSAGASFTVKDGHTVLLDRDLDIFNLQVGDGTSGILSFENSAVRNVIVRQLVNVLDGGLFNVTTSGNAIHNLDLRGGINTNLIGQVNLFNNSNQTCDLSYNSAYGQIIGNNPVIVNNFYVNSLAVPAAIVNAQNSLYINGNININSNGTFLGSNYPHTVSGYWNQAATGVYNGSTSGTIVFNSSTVQAISNPSIFRNVIFNGGSTSQINNVITILGDLIIDNNTNVSSAAFNNYLYGNFNLITGNFSHNAGATFFLAGSGIQTVTGITANFSNLNTLNSGEKILDGDINAINVTIANNTTLSGYSNTQNLNISGNLNFGGILNYNGNINMSSTSNNPSYIQRISVGNMDFGQATLNINATNNLIISTLSGSFSTCFIKNAININSGSVFLANNTSLRGGITFPGSGTISIANAARIVQQGATNYPYNFANYNYNTGSFYRMDQTFSQSFLGGISYGNMELRNGPRNVAAGPCNVTILGNVDFNNTASSSLDLGNTFCTAEIRGSINNATLSSITGLGTVIFNNPDASQTLGASLSYLFGNLFFTQTAPTAARNKTINANVTINGTFQATNTGGDNILLNNIVLGTNQIIGGSGTTKIQLGDNTRIQTSILSPNNFYNGISVSNISLTGASIVNFNDVANNSFQEFPPLTYGNVQLNGPGGANSNIKIATLGGANIVGSIVRNGGTPIFVDGGFTHTISGDWLLAQAYYTPSSTTSTILFNGTNQNIGPGSANLGFQNLIFANSGGNITHLPQSGGETTSINGNVIFNNGSSFVSSNKNIFISGNWINTGTGVSLINGGTHTFNAISSNDQLISGNGQSYFNNITVNRLTSPNLNLVALNNFTVNGTITLSNGASQTSGANLDISNRIIEVKGNLTEQPGTSITFNSLTGVIFSGSSAQTIANGNSSPFLNNVTFSGSGTKTFANGGGGGNGGTYANTHIYTGNVVIQSGPTLNAQNLNIQTFGNWLSYGSFTHTATLSLVGVNQTILGNSFNSVFLANSGTKILQGNTDIAGALTIGTGVTFDINPSNYSINVSGNWTNNGFFNQGTGTVNLLGNNANITTGAISNTTSGKNFYNLIINKNAGQTATSAGDINIQNDLYINSGTLNIAGTNGVWLNGNLYNNGGNYNQNNATGLTLYTTVPGTYVINPGISGSLFGSIIQNTPGSTYYLANPTTITSGRMLLINSGTMSLAGTSLSLIGGGVATVVSLTGGTLDIDAGGALYLANQNSIINNGGTFKVVGSGTLFSNIGRHSSSPTGGYIITQNAGTFNARNFNIQNLNYAVNGIGSQGIVFNGGTLDPVNNFSGGTFNNGFTGSQQYINFDNITLPGMYSLSGITFNSGPIYNIRRASVAGANFFTLINPQGPLGSFSFENDNPALSQNSGNFVWKKVGKFWVGTNPGTAFWENTNNWSDNLVPSATDSVILDHSFVAGKYNVTIGGTSANAYRIVIDNQGLTTAGISLILSPACNQLKVENNIDVYVANTLSGINSNNIINVGKTFNNSGTFLSGGGTVALTGSLLGTGFINSGNSPFNILSIAGPGTLFQLNNPFSTNDLFITDGNLDVTSGNNFPIYVSRNYAETGSGALVPRTGTIFFNGSSNQSINGSNFYNVSFTGASQKYIISSPSFQNSLIISNNATVNGLTNNLYIGGAFTNNVASNAFQQTGTGAIWFNGAGAQNINNGTQTTVFNNLYLLNPGVKTFFNNFTVTGDFTINSGTGNVDLQTFTGISNNPSSTFSHFSTNTLFLRGANNFPQNFGTYNIANGSITEYRADINQTISGLTYGTLTLSTATAPTPSVISKIASGSFIVQNNLNIGRNANDTRVVLDISAANGDITLGGNLSIVTTASQIIWGSNSTLFHNGAGWNIDPDITGFNNLNLGGTGTKTQFNTLTISGNVQLNNGVTLNMSTFPMIGNSSKSLTMISGSILNSQIVSATGFAFPTGFGTYNINSSSTTNINSGVGDQNILPISYGNLNITTNNGGNPANAALQGNTTVTGNYVSNANAILNDNSYNITAYGDMNISNYPSPSPSSTFYLIGNAQTITNSQNNTPYLLPGIYVGGTAGKTITGNNCGSSVSVLGNIFVSLNTSLNFRRDVSWFGNYFTNNGSLDAINGCNATFNVAGNSIQTINPGLSNSFYAFTVSNTLAPVLFTGNGGNFRNVFSINSGGNVHMGNGLTHYFGSSLFQGGPPATSTIQGNWTTSGANFVFDGGNQSIPDLIVSNVTFAGGGVTKRLVGSLLTGNLYIGTSTVLNTNATNTTPLTTDNPITITGNLLNDGTYTGNLSRITFKSAIPNVLIQTNASNLSIYDVDFLPNSTTSYTLGTTSNNYRFARSMNIACGATLNLNSTNLYFGSNLPSGKIFSVSGVLNINQNAYLLINNAGSQSILTVSGSCAALSVIGLNSGNKAIISVETGAAGNGSIIQINNGAKLAAQYYGILNLADQGMYVGPSAVLDPINNLSNGSFDNMRNAGGGARYYLILDANLTGVNSITGLVLNYSGTPTVGTQYNIYRSSSATGIAYINYPLNGTLGVYNYEFDPANTLGAGVPDANSGKIIWPVTQTLTWNGSIGTNWKDSLNWTPNRKPTILDNVIIPGGAGIPNNPSLITEDAYCRDMTITNGNLQLSNNFNLSISGTLTLGTGASAATLAVNSGTSKITMGGSWVKNANSTFIPSNGTVSFECNPGTYTINNGTSSFNNLALKNSPITYQLSGSQININGDLLITNNASVTPLTNNYRIFLKGNYQKDAGSLFNNGVALGTIILNGANQSITGMYCYNLSVAGTGTKLFIGQDTVVNLLNVDSYMQSEATNVHRLLGDVNIKSTGTFDDGGQSHNFLGTNWTGSGNYAGAGTINFIRTAAQNINASKFNNILLGNTTTNLLGNVTTTGDVNVQLVGGGNFNFLTNTIININNLGNFNVNNSAQNLYIRGTNNAPSGFNTYNFNASSNTYFDAAFNQTIGGISYGILNLLNNTKTLGGDISVGTNLNINNGTTLDVSPNNYSINIGGNFNNNGNGSFICQQGQVIFDGNAANQIIYNGAIGVKDFYQLTVNKTGTNQVYLWNSNNNNRILDNLYVLGGNFNIGGGTVVTIGGDMFATGGKFTTNGTYVLNQQGGIANIQFNGSSVPNMIINAPGTTYTLQDNMIITNNFNIVSGTFDGNGKSVVINGTSNNINGTYKIGAGGSLGIGNGAGTASFTIGTGGSFEAIGNSSNVAKITQNNTGNRYSFQVGNGATISANYYLFEYMNTSGVVISSGATIDGVNNLSNGTFNNGAAGTTFLTIDNDQTMTISAVNFPQNPGGAGPYNVSKPTSSAGILYFDNASGVFSGEGFDFDPYDNINPYNTPPYLGLIKWTGPITLTWNGSISSNWFDPNNWTPSSGPNIVPTGAEHVVIAFPNGAQPVINFEGALANNLTINSGAVLNINTTAIGTDLTINGDLIINGTIQTNGANDNIVVLGNYTKGGSGSTAYNTNSTISFTGMSGNKGINNGANAFPNVVIAGTANFQLNATTNIYGNLDINSGTLDGSSNTIIIRKSFINRSNFNSGNNTILFAGNPSGTYTFNPGSSVYSSIQFSTFNSTYNLASNLSTKSNITMSTLSGNTTLNLNGNSITLGDNIGTDQLNIGAGCIVNIGGGSSVLMSNNGSINVSGRLNIVGSTSTNTANILIQSAGTYGIDINSGGTLGAKYYVISNLNTNGIRILSGANLDPTNNLSEGSFTSGASGGRYLLFSNTMPNTTLTNVSFNSGPSFSIERTLSSISGIVNVFDSKGLLGSFFYEKDDQYPTQSAATGSIQWTYSAPVAYWSGNVSSDWQDSNNWYDQNNLPTLPTINTNTFIPDVSIPPYITNTYPLLSSIAGATKNFTLNSNSRLTLSGVNLSVSGAFTAQSGSTFIVATVGSPIIKAYDLWQNIGSFIPGTSTVELLGATGTYVISNGNNAFYNLKLNSSTGGANFQATSNLSISNNLDISSGIFTINSSTYVISIGGNWTNNSTYISNGSTATFIKSSGNQSISGTSVTAFGKLNISSTGNKVLYLASNISVTSDVNINGSNCTFNGGSFTIDLFGNWNNTAKPFVSQGMVRFLGNTSQNINRSGGENFNNVSISGGSTKILTKDVNIAGTLFLSNGVINTGVNKVNVLQGASITGGNSNSYVQGIIQKYINTGTGVSYTFEVGDGNYLPVNVFFPNVTSGGTFTAKATNGDHPNISSCLNSTRSVNKYWTLNGSGISPIYFNSTFNFITSNYDAGSNPLNFNIGKYAAATWSMQTLGSVTGTYTQALGISGYGDFQIAEIGSAGGIGSTISGIPASPICQGTTVSFTALGTNLGATPTYKWMVNNSVVGSNIANFTTSSLINNDNILVIVTSSGTCYLGSVVTSNGIAMTVHTIIGNSSISGNQLVCANVLPSSLTGTSVTGGNASTYTYQWQSSTTSSTTGFNPASGTNNGINYLFPANLSTNTWYRRTVVSGACSNTTSGILVSVVPIINNNNIGSAQTICSGLTPNSLTGSNPTGGSGVFTFAWEVSTISGSTGFASISGTNTGYVLGVANQSSWYRRIVNSSVCNNTSTGVAIVVSTSGIWIGLTNSNWNTANNWCGSIIPNASMDISLINSTPNYPIVDAPGASIKSLYISPSASVGVSSGNTLTLGGSLINNGSFSTSSNSTVVFNGASVQSVSGINTFNNILIDKTTTLNGVTFLNDQNLIGTLTLQNNSNLITNGIVFTLVSSSTTGTARIASIPSSSLITGNIRYQRYIPAKRAFRFLASPVTNATINHWREFGSATPGQGMFVTGVGAGSDVGSSVPTISTYYEPYIGDQNLGYFAVGSGINTTLTSGVGYRVFVRGDRTINLATNYVPTNTTLNLSGKPFIGNLTVPLSFTSTTGTITADGWNLLGNPYPSQIDWRNMSASGVNIDNAFYIFDPESGNASSTGNYYTYVNGVGSAPRTNPSIIPSGQSFFVKAKGTGASIQFTENAKSSLIGQDNFREEKISSLLYVALQSGTNTDYTAVRFVEGATNDFDPNFDAYKLKNSQLNISTYTSGNEYSINSMPLIDFSTKSVPLNVGSLSIGSYSITLSNLSSFESHIKVYLKDNYLQNSTLITEGYSYSFQTTSDLNSKGNSRFELVFEPQLGSISGFINPDSINGKWNIDGNNIWYSNKSVIQNISEGLHEITFSTVAGFVTPQPISIQVKASDITTFSGKYIPAPKFGSLTVLLTPSSINKGRQKTYWSLDKITWNESNKTLDNLEVGTYILYFSDLSGYNTPKNQSISIIENLITTATGYYIENLTNQENIIVENVDSLNKPIAIVSNISDNPLKDFSFKVYPNPYFGINDLNIELNNSVSKKIKIEIYNSKGLIVINNDFTINSDIQSIIKIKDFNELSNGIYVLRLIIDGKIVNCKIVKN